MNVDREELAYWIATVTPWEAVNDAVLREASAYAATRVQKLLPGIAERHKEGVLAKVNGHRWAAEEIAREAIKRGRRIRNMWLKRHGSLGDRRFDG